MKSSVAIAGFILIYFFIGVIAQETGLTEPIIKDAVAVPDSPSTGDGFLDGLNAALTPFKWAFNAIGGLFLLATFQSDGVPAAVNSLIFAPLGFVLLWAGIKMIRGINT